MGSSHIVTTIISVNFLYFIFNILSLSKTTIVELEKLCPSQTLFENVCYMCIFNVFQLLGCFFYYEINNISDKYILATLISSILTSLWCIINLWGITCSRETNHLMIYTMEIFDFGLSIIYFVFGFIIYLLLSR